MVDQKFMCFTLFMIMAASCVMAQGQPPIVMSPALRALVLTNKRNPSPLMRRVANPEADWIQTYDVIY